MIRFFLVVEMRNASNERGMALSFRPPNRFVLRLEGGEYVIRMILDDIVNRVYFCPCSWCEPF